MISLKTLSGKSSGLPIDSVLTLNAAGNTYTNGDEVWLREGWVDTDVSAYPDAQKRVKIDPTRDTSKGWDIPTGVTAAVGIVCDGSTTYTFERGDGTEPSKTYMYRYDQVGTRSLVVDSWSSGIYQNLRGGVVSGGIIHGLNSGNNQVQKIHPVTGGNHGSVALSNTPTFTRDLVIVGDLYLILTTNNIFTYSITGDLVSTHFAHPEGSGSVTMPNGKFMVYDGLYLHVGYEDGSVKVFSVSGSGLSEEVQTGASVSIRYLGVTTSIGNGTANTASYNGRELVYSYGVSGSHKIGFSNAEDYVGLPYASYEYGLDNLPATYTRVK